MLKNSSLRKNFTDLRYLTARHIKLYFKDKQTFFMSLIFEGRLSCFQPVTWLDRTQITQIRPLLYCGENLVRHTARRLSLPVVENPCPANGNTKRQEIKELIYELQGRYPGLKSRVFGSMQRLPLPEWGPVEHRRRPLPELKASQAVTRNFGERVARNMPIQGTAADIIKIAMVRVYRRLREEKLRTRLILQVHDELIVEAPQEEADKATTILQEEMEAAADLSVKLAVDAHTGETWYDAKG